MSKKITVGVLFGGRSAEHEVSLRSARTVVSALDSQKYDVVLIGLDREGRWYLGDTSHKLLASAQVSQQGAAELSSPSVALTPTGSDRKLFNIVSGQEASKLDVLFPVLHGPYGEDGTVQGLAKLANIACVGAGVLGSAIGMDKDVMKRLLKEAGLPVGAYVTITKNKRSGFSYSTLSKKLGTTMFVKPANLGSSIGVSKVTTASEFEKALDDAFEYDRKVIVEEFIAGREIELSVLGNDDVQVSVPGEIKSGEAFYSYDAKYSSTSQSQSIIPADLPKKAVKKVQTLAAQTFKVLECRGMARVDFFYTPEGEFLINEINTIPGFTSISMYPKLWEASGVPLTELLDRLISLALEEYQENATLLTTPNHDG